MDKNDILKRNLLKRLYCKEEVIPEETKETNLSSHLHFNACCKTKDIPDIKKPKIYSASLAPPNYKCSTEVKDSTQLNTPEKSSSSESSEEDDDIQTNRKRRRRGRRKKEIDNVESDGKSLTETVTVNNAQLTKNKKRKLKKKRRKEKLKQENKSVPFSYVDADVTNVTDFPSSNNTEEKPMKDKVNDLMEFLDAVWDLYKQEGTMKSNLTSEHNKNQQTLMDILQGYVDGLDVNKELTHHIKCLCTIKKYLALNHQSKAREEITEYKDKVIMGLDNEVKMFVCKLMEYWLTDIMPKR